jgi:rhodanese-related sulfurtransferase
MDAGTLRTRLHDVMVLDVRYPNEWQAGHIENARHVQVDYLHDHLEDFERDRPIVTVCLSGARSREAAATLRGEGFDAESLDGGVQEWAARRLPLVAADGTPGTVAQPEEPPDDRPVHMQQLQDTFLEVIFAVKEHFGEREPSEEEIHTFLKDRLVAEGKTLAEAELFLQSDDDPS